jgi:protein gp37
MDWKMGKTNIEWVRDEDGSMGKSWNPMAGCTMVSEGCRNCYAMRMATRIAGAGLNRSDPTPAQVAYDKVLLRRGGKLIAKWNGKVRVLKDRIQQPLHWRDPCHIFVNSMTDLFHGGLYGQEHGDDTWVEGQFNGQGFNFLVDIWSVMSQCPQHTFHILTKRPRIMADMVWRAMAKLNMNEPLPNVWLGTSVENQEAADTRIPHLLNCPAVVRFLSCEPLLGPIRFSDVPGFNRLSIIDDIRRMWIIVGGESGPGARPCNIGWIRSIIEQCNAAGVPCFVKQLGKVPVEVDRCVVCAGTGAIEVDGVDQGCPACRQGCKQSFLLDPTDPKGGDMSEWPEDLRIREFPA